MRIVAAVLAIAAGMWGQEVESVQPAYAGPGDTITIKFKAALETPQRVVLYVDGKAKQEYVFPLEKGAREAVFTVPADTKDTLFQAAAVLPVSIGPAAGPAWRSNSKVKFGPERLEIEKVEPLAISPGEKFKFTFKTAPRTSHGLVLFVDGEEAPQLMLGTKMGSKEAWLEIPAEVPAEIKKYFQSAAYHAVSVAPLREEPWTPQMSSIEFEPAGVIAVSRTGAPLVCSSNLEAARANDQCRLRLGDQIRLKVATPAVNAVGAADIVLWIDGSPLPNLKATRDTNPGDPQFTDLVFNLPNQISALGDSPDAGAIATKDVWMRVLRRPWEQRGIKISAGKIDSPLLTRIVDYKVQRLHLWWMIFWSLFFVYVIFWLYRVATRTGLLREEEVRPTNPDLTRLQADADAASAELERAKAALAAPPENADLEALKKVSAEADARKKAADDALAKAKPATAPPQNQPMARASARMWKTFLANVEIDSDAQKRAYSLARTQMLLWSLIVAMSMVWIWQVTNNNDVMKPSVLLLMGISVGTTLSAATVDKNKQAEAENAIQNDANDPKAAAVLATPQTEGFWADLVSDRNGPAIGRVQMVIFTMILMGMFIYDTITTLVMPEFSGTLLGLMGVTSATYVSFKIPEKKV